MDFDITNFQIEQVCIDSETIRYRAYRNLSYCRKPKDPIQKMNLYVPEAYFEGKMIQGYSLKSAPIVMPNTVGGYMPGPAGEPGADNRGKPNFIFSALQHGYVVACAGVRGRSTGRKCQEFFVGGVVNQPKEEDGELCGKAPAYIVDLKAAIRYLRHNKAVVPGDTEKIFTNGTSAGGALSALAGTTGNHPDYTYYLQEIGAADEPDDVYGAICFCPIIDLEHADAAYEWQFNGLEEAHFIKFSFDERGQIHMEPEVLQMSQQQMKWSEELKADFPDYVNSLALRDPEGAALTLDESGNGNFKEYIIKELIHSAQSEVNAACTSAQRLGWPSCDFTEVKKLPYLSWEGERITGLDWDCYIRTITRMKAVPAFDQVNLASPENDEFGTPEEPARHFTEFGLKHTIVNGTMAEEPVIKMLNPICYIQDSQATCAKHWWIRHGSNDRDTSLAIPVILELSLQNAGAEVDFKLPWGLPHSGDYDLPELFAWIDSLVDNGLS